MTTARLEWVTRGRDDEPYWELVLVTLSKPKDGMQTKTHTVFGRLYISQFGYVAITAGSGPNTSIPLGGHLTLDEAKSAAKLVLMTRKQ